ncbi:MAG TPA: primosomal protein N' [Terriglobia bacterium]|nr:primosomal protein N' [Terriglobia bacterium]
MSRKKQTDRLIDVAVIAAIRHPLTYRVPESMDVRTGHRVLVPLGNRRAMGIALEPKTHIAPGVKVREILRVVDPVPLLSAELLTLGLWIADYYVAPVGEVFRAMLPLRSTTRRVQLIRITDLGRDTLEELDSSLLEEVKQGAEVFLLRHLAEKQSSHPGGIPLEGVQKKFSAVNDNLVGRAIEEGWASLIETERERARRKTFSVQLRAELMSGSVQGPVPQHALRLSPSAQRIIEALKEQGPAEDHRELLKSTRGSLPTLRKLHDQGWVELSNTSSESVPEPRLEDQLFATQAETPSMAGPELTLQQSVVFEDLAPRLASHRFEVALLHGVTGSGKTEVYLRLITRCLDRGRGALMLVPEIALTPAVESQFVARFGNRVAVLHSGLSELERHEAWWRVRRGDGRVVLGTRSAVFAPVDDLGLVIVDEEHESGYKQEETPRYHGRDVAVVRARLSKALAVLGSATPSLESYSNAREGKYHLCTLEERVAGRSLARVEIIDMRQEFRETHTQVPMSRHLRQEIEAQLTARAQTMILLNRRGYSWFLLCRNCGQSVRCVNCSISLTYHRREHRLICHYCGYSTSVPSCCPGCQSEHMHYVGEGTERIEQKLAELFPGARVERLDRDVARRRAHFRRILQDFREGRIDILVGTQLIAKGHDFPGVTLVGVVSADMGLGLPDFRAAERTFQLLTQAAGRAGRGDAPGRVLVQTFFPEHYAIRLAAEQNYESFFAKEMRFRRLMHYPPITALANVIAQHSELEQAARYAKQIGHFLETSPVAQREVKVLGPSPAPRARIQGFYRIQFLLRSRSRGKLNSVLQELVGECERLGVPPRSVMIDMDPASVM